MSGESARALTGEARDEKRLRAGLRRHGVARRPAPIRSRLESERLRFRDGNAVEVFDAGGPALARMLEAISAARQRVHLETYILRADVTGRRFLEALRERAEAGVAVRVLYDGLGSRGLDPRALLPLHEAGADVVTFNPLRRFYPRWAPRRRDHRKILCVDGEVAFAGGLNIGDEYSGEGGAGWRDTHLCVRGPAVRDLEAVFLESWFRADGPDLPWHELVEGHSEPVGDVRCAVVPDGPTYRRRRMRELLVAGLREAREHVRIASPYFAPGRAVLQALADAGERARVELVLAGRTDHPILRRAARTLIPRLVDSGVTVYEYERVVMHAKMACFDGRWAIVGSSNLDRQSFEHSYEVNLVLEGGDVCQRIDAMFERDLGFSRAVDRTTLARRGLLDRLLDRLAAIVLRLI